MPKPVSKKESGVRRLRPVWAFAWAAASVILATALWAGYRAAPGMSLFLLQSVQLEGAERTGRAEVIRAAGLEDGMRLHDIDVEEIRRSIEGLPWVRRARVSRQLPSTIKVEIAERQPRYLARLDRLYYLTRDATAVSAPLDQGLDYAVITGLTRVDLMGNGPLKTGLLELFEVLEQDVVREELSELNADSATGFTMYLVSGGGMGIRLGFSNFEGKLRHLSRLRRHLERRGQEARAVNLTHEGRVVARLVGTSGKDSKP